jgi:hypothetical protein
MERVTEGTPLPLQDGQKFTDSRGYAQQVGGSIRADDHIHVVPQERKEYDPSVCWTLRGDWFRRSDGVGMTRASGELMTIGEFYAWRRKQRERQ